MADKWNIELEIDRSYRQTITVSGITDIATATAWHLDAAMPNAAPFLQASTSNGLMVAGATSAQKILVVPASVTATYPLGGGRFEFWIEWAGGEKRAYYRGAVQVVPYVGQVTA